MTEQIKNVSDEILIFDGFTIAKNEKKDIIWSLDFLTPKNFALIVAFLEVGKLKYYDKNGGEKSGKKESKYKVMDANRNLSQLETVEQIDESIVEINQKYRALHKKSEIIYVKP